MKPWLVATTFATLCGCSSMMSPAVDVTAKAEMDVIQATQPVLSGAPLTLQQIMADPQWIGNAPVSPRWGDDSASVVYSSKRPGSPLYDLYRLPLGGEAAIVPLSQLHESEQSQGVFSADGRFKAYIFKGNVFVKELSSGRLRQLTRDNTPQSQPTFLNDGRLAYRQENSLYAIALENGVSQLLAELQLADEPQEENEADSYLGAQQARLIKYVALQAFNRQQRKAEKDQLHTDNPSLAAKPFYLGKQQTIAELSLSPNGRYLLVATEDKDYQWRAKHDIMPNYLDAKGYVDSVPARARVAEDQPPGQQLRLLDLQTGQQQAIGFNDLPGYDSDVLASVKQQNYAQKGKVYESEKRPRKIRLMQDWGWEQSAVVWNQDGSRLGIMLEAIDNKDRWLTHYDFDKQQLDVQHHLHDEAWINYTHNEFGWLKQEDTLYYLSEESGYSQLYIKPLDGKARALTSGAFEVSRLTLSRDGDYFYYKANKKHPGKYDIFRVARATGESEALTDLNGMTDYWLSPDQQQLLLSHSKLLQPQELYVQPALPGGKATRLTHTVSEEFAAYDWQAPQIIEIPSSHVDAPIYAKLYLPTGFDSRQGKKYPAVVFNHGAGYLQNSHYGWSGYFREFMFHNLLAQQGYVVLDMDYRASKGYGRDWRTAIYRQMGTPEVEDLQDGVNYLVDNVQVARDRIGTYGGSYGGFLTFMALFTEPELFQSGAALRPVTDWAHYNHGYTSNILNTPEVDPMAYERSSPIEHAQGLNKPLLIMSGVLDDNVFFQDSVRLVQRLIELEKPMFETAIYPVEPHGFRQPSSWLDEYRRIFKLFEQTLK